MAGYVPGEQPVGEGVIKLNTNENPYPPSPRVAAAVNDGLFADLRLYPDPEGGSFRKAVAELHGCADSQVFVANGSDEALALCTRAFVENDGSIGYFSPSYSLYPVLADIRGAVRKPVELGEKFGWRMPRGYRASLFFLTTPSAPSGIRYPRNTVEEFCRTFPGVVVLDEAYVDFAEDNYMDMALNMDNVLVARSMSKSFSLAGLRAGYIAGNEKLIDALRKIKDSYNVGALTQRLAVEAIRDIDYMRENVAKIKASRERLASALRKMGFEVGRSETNFLWARPSDISAEALFERLKSMNVYVRYFPGERTGGFVRISIGTDREIDKLLECVSLICSS